MIRSTCTVTLGLLLLASTASAQWTDARHEVPEIQTEAQIAANQGGATTDAPADVRSTIQGFSLGVLGSTTALSRLTNRNASSSGGLVLAVGYGLSDRVALHAATSGAWVDPSNARDSFFLSHVDVEGRYSLGRASSQWRPHVSLGVSGQTKHRELAAQGADTTVDLRVRPTAGAGLSYYLSKSIAVDGWVRYTVGGVQRTRAYAGVSWYPRAR